MISNVIILLLLVVILIVNKTNSHNINTYKNLYANNLKTLSSSSLLLLSSSIYPLKSIAAIDKNNENQGLNLKLDEVANIIKDNCKIILNNARISGKLLYRGDGDKRNILNNSNNNNNTILNNKVLISNPKSDLLLPDTYDNSPLAVDYFKKLDELMIEKKYLVHPGNGHIATSNLYDASDWGEVYSIWPFDNNLHYVWINTGSRNENKFWEVDWGLPQGSRGPLFWKNDELMSKFMNGITYDKDLDEIMSKSGEIMFTRLTNGKDDKIIQNINEKYKTKLKLMSPLYIAIPIIYDSDIMKLLEIEPFSSEIKIMTSTKSMILDDVPISRKYNSLVFEEGKGYSKRYGNPFLY